MTGLLRVSCMYSLTCISKTRLKARALIPGYWEAVVQSHLHQNLASGQGFDVRLLGGSCTASTASKTWLRARDLMSGYWETMYSLTCIRDLAKGKRFDVRLLGDSCTASHASKTSSWLQARGLMSGYWETVVQHHMHQRPGF